MFGYLSGLAIFLSYLDAPSRRNIGHMHDRVIARPVDASQRQGAGALCLLK